MTTIGKKFIVAVTGLVMLGFVIGHLAGNLQIFLGPTAINDYAKYLHDTTALLWGTRIVLLISIFLHFYYTIQLSLRNKASRPEPYAAHAMVQANVASRFMLWSGLFLASYIIFHILHLTTGTVHPAFSPVDIYGNMIAGFSSAPVTFFYLLAMVSLGMHLYHGVYSVFQTLGLNHPKYNQFRRYLAMGAGILIPLGYSSIPLAVLLGIVK